MNPGSALLVAAMRRVLAGECSPIFAEHRELDVLSEQYWKDGMPVVVAGLGTPGDPDILWRFVTQFGERNNIVGIVDTNRSAWSVAYSESTKCLDEMWIKPQKESERFPHPASVFWAHIDSIGVEPDEHTKELLLAAEAAFIERPEKHELAALVCSAYVNDPENRMRLYYMCKYLSQHLEIDGMIEAWATIG